MQLEFVYDPSVAAAPDGFLTGLAAAASYLDSLITNPITVTIQVGWGEDDGLAIPSNALASGAPYENFLSYATVRSELAASASTDADAESVANLPAVDPFPGNMLVSTALEKAWGILPSSAGGIDGSVGFGTALPFSFDPANRAVPGEFDFIGTAEHEITHALGRVTNLPSSGTPLDLFRYLAPGVNATNDAQAAYFSIDGGVTALDPFDTVVDPGDWASSVKGDSFGYSVPDTIEQITPTDVTEMDVLGFTVAPAVATITDPGSQPVINLSGIAEVTLIGDAHTINVSEGADTIFAAAGSGSTTINNAGAVFFYAGSTAGTALDLLTGPGAATLVGASNNVMVNQNQGPGAGVMMVAGAGNETLFGAASPTNDQYWASFTGGNDFMAAGSGTDILVAGNGADTLAGGAGNDVFYVISSRLIAASTTNASAGQDVIYGARAGDILALTGFDALYGAAGAAARSVSAALASGGNTVTLADGTTITFAGATAGLQVISS